MQRALDEVTTARDEWTKAYDNGAGKGTDDERMRWQYLQQTRSRADRTAAGRTGRQRSQLASGLAAVGGTYAVSELVGVGANLLTNAGNAYNNPQGTMATQGAHANVQRWKNADAAANAIPVVGGAIAGVADLAGSTKNWVIGQGFQTNLSLAERNLRRAQTREETFYGNREAYNQAAMARTYDPAEAIALRKQQKESQLHRELAGEEYRYNMRGKLIGLNRDGQDKRAAETSRINAETERETKDAATQSKLAVIGNRYEASGFRRAQAAAEQQAGRRFGRDEAITARMGEIDDGVGKRRDEYEAVKDSTVASAEDKAAKLAALRAAENAAVAQEAAERVRITRDFAEQDQDILDEAAVNRLRAAGRHHEAEELALRQHWAKMVRTTDDGTSKQITIEGQAAAERARHAERTRAILGEMRGTRQEEADFNGRGAAEQRQQVEDKFREDVQKESLLEADGSWKPVSRLAPDRRQKREQLIRQRAIDLAKIDRQSRVTAEDMKGEASGIRDRMGGREYEAEQDAIKRRKAARIIANKDGDTGLKAIDELEGAETAANDQNRARSLRGYRSGTRQAKLRSEGKNGQADVEALQQQYLDDYEAVQNDPERRKEVQERYKAIIKGQIRGDQKSEMFGSAADYAESALMRTMNSDPGKTTSLQELYGKIERGLKTDPAGANGGDPADGPRAEAERRGQSWEKFDRLLDKFGRVVDEMANIETIG
jgi:hypothetical protein